MTLIKIPLIAATSWAFKKCIAPLNLPPPKGSKLVRANRAEKEWYAYVVTQYAAHLQYLIALLESTTLLALAYPTTSPAPLILSLTGRPNLHLSALHILGSLLILSGAAIRLSTFKHMGSLFTFGAICIHPNHQLITSGPYTVVRHPSYTGMLLSHPGWFLWQFSRGSWVRESGILGTRVGQGAVAGYAVLVVLFPLYLVLSRMGVEDGLLRERFGREWEDWAGRVEGCPWGLLSGKVRVVSERLKDVLKIIL